MNWTSHLDDTSSNPSDVNMFCFGVRLHCSNAKRFCFCVRLHYSNPGMLCHDVRWPNSDAGKICSVVSLFCSKAGMICTDVRSHRNEWPGISMNDGHAKNKFGILWTNYLRYLHFIWSYCFSFTGWLLGIMSLLYKFK